jgi:hypothetical protein
MDYRRRSFWRRAVTWVFVPVAAAAFAEEKPHPLEGGEKVGLSFSLLATPREGATWRMVAMGPFDLGVGESMVHPDRATPFAFGALGDPGGCGAGVTTEPVAAVLARYRYAWTADVTLLEASRDRLVLGATWERFESGPAGSPVRSAGGTIPQVSLREGERVLIDFVAPPLAAEPPCMRNFALELTAELREDPALAGKQIAYDLWLVHDAPNGEKTSRRWEATLRHGEKTRFQFPHEMLPVQTIGNGPQQLQVDVTGHVRGRIRKDGALELALGTERMLSYVSSDGGGGDGGVGESGEKTVRVQPEEAIRVELPGAPRGAGKREELMTRDLAGHSFALVLRAKPLS